MRYIPELIFRYDESVQYGSRIETLLREINATDRDDDRED